MARGSRVSDRDRDLEAGRDAERYVRERLFRHPAVRRVADLSTQPETPDFEFQYESERVGLEVKSKLNPLSDEYRQLWPQVPEPDLFILDEAALRTLSWAEGMGYVVIADKPMSRWVVLGPWELLLAPRRRFERLSDDRKHPQKGKLLFDLRTGLSMDDFVVDALLQFITTTRSTRGARRPIRLQGQPDLPVVPQTLAPAANRQGEPATQAGPLQSPESSQDEAEASASAVDAEPSAPETLSEIWCGLSAHLADAIALAHGWKSPTEVQRAAIPPVLAGHNTLVLAPTAGGKTEAALLPLLDLVRREGWKPTSILAVSPMKALLDDQLGRYQALGRLVGATAFAWHGDTTNDQRKSFIADRTDVLLTTPESLEILLHRSDARDVLGGIRAVVVDEVHAMVGTARGAQLAAVLERLEQRCRDDLQRVGLSATVGTPDEVLAWLGGSSYRERTLAGVSGAATQEETSIVSYADDTELAATLGGVLAEQSSLAFVPSRRRAEHLGAALRVPIHHSSLSAAGRSAAVSKFRSGEVTGIVATSTLELGIDIGDVELVVQDGAPPGPASYLQRVGRSGRRTGVRRMLFTCGTPDDLLQVLAVLARVRRGQLEPFPARRGARLMLGQQALALALDPARTGFERHDLVSALCYSPVFRGLQDDARATLDHLVEQDWLLDIHGILVAGHRANTEYGGGGRKFARLAASFDTRASISVVTEDGMSVGSIDWAVAQDDKAIPSGLPFRLGGKSWQAVEVTNGVVRVVPASAGLAAKAPSWRGPSLDVERSTWETAREILESTEVPAAMDQRCAQWLEILRAQWRPRIERPVSKGSRETTVATFAGAAVHRSVLRVLDAEGSGDGPELRIISPDLATVRSRTGAALASLEDVLDSEARRLAATIGGPHRELVPPSVLHAEAAEFAVDGEGIRKVLMVLSAG